jgi:hypothetical protein
VNDSRMHPAVVDATSGACQSWCGELAALGKATEHRAIELRDLDCVFFQEGAAAIARELALARRQRNASPQR